MRAGPRAKTCGDHDRAGTAGSSRHAVYEHWEKIDNLASPLYFPAMLAEHPKPVVIALQAIANAAPGCVVFHCAGGKDRTGLLALVLLSLVGVTPDEIIADYLLTYDRMKQRYDELGYRDQLTAVSEILAKHNTIIEASLNSTIASLMRCPTSSSRTVCPTPNSPPRTPA